MDMASKIALPDTVGKVGSFGELKAPGSELTCQARLLTGQPAQRAGEQGVPARPTLPQLLPEQEHVKVAYTRYRTYLCSVFASKFLSYFSNMVLNLILREKKAFYIFIPIHMSG
jgi:hypothetical protein